MKPKVTKKVRPSPQISSPPVSPTAPTRTAKRRRIESRSPSSSFVFALPSSSSSSHRKASSSSTSTIKLDPLPPLNIGLQETNKATKNAAKTKVKKEEPKDEPLAEIDCDVKPPPEFMGFDYHSRCLNLMAVLARSDEQTLQRTELHDLQHELEAMLSHTMDFLRRAHGDLQFLSSGEYPTVNLRQRAMPNFQLQIHPTEAPMSPTTSGDIVSPFASGRTMVVPHDDPDDSLDVWPPVHVPTRFWKWLRATMIKPDLDVLQGFYKKYCRVLDQKKMKRLYENAFEDAMAEKRREQRHAMMAAVCRQVSGGKRKISLQANKNGIIVAAEDEEKHPAELSSLFDVMFFAYLREHVAMRRAQASSQLVMVKREPVDPSMPSPSSTNSHQYRENGHWNGYEKKVKAEPQWESDEEEEEEEEEEKDIKPKPHPPNGLINGYGHLNGYGSHNGHAVSNGYGSPLPSPKQHSPRSPRILFNGEKQLNGHHKKSTVSPKITLSIKGTVPVKYTVASSKMKNGRRRNGEHAKTINNNIKLNKLPPLVLPSPTNGKKKGKRNGLLSPGKGSVEVRRGVQMEDYVDDEDIARIMTFMQSNLSFVMDTCFAFTFQFVRMMNEEGRRGTPKKRVSFSKHTMLTPLCRKLSLKEQKRDKEEERREKEKKERTGTEGEEGLLEEEEDDGIDEVTRELMRAQDELQEVESECQSTLRTLRNKIIRDVVYDEARKRLEKTEEELFNLHTRLYREVPRRVPNDSEIPVLAKALAQRKKAARVFYGSRYWAQPRVRPDHPMWLSGFYSESAPHQQKRNAFSTKYHPVQQMFKEKDDGDTSSEEEDCPHEQMVRAMGEHSDYAHPPYKYLSYPVPKWYIPDTPSVPSTPIKKEDIKQEQQDTPPPILTPQKLLLFSAPAKQPSAAVSSKVPSKTSKAPQQQQQGKKPLTPAPKSPRISTTPQSARSTPCSSKAPPGQKASPSPKLSAGISPRLAPVLSPQAMFTPPPLPSPTSRSVELSRTAPPRDKNHRETRHNNHRKSSDSHHKLENHHDHDVIHVYTAPMPTRYSRRIKEEPPDEYDYA